MFANFLLIFGKLGKYIPIFLTIEKNKYLSNHASNNY